MQGERIHRRTIPVVAIVGRPNVGKSTLFNRLVGKRLAVVADVPGVTRDRHYAQAQMFDRDILLLDTGGFDPTSGDPMTSNIVKHVKIALEEADVIVCVLDATSGSLPHDFEAVKLLRNTQKPVLFVANKADSSKRAAQATSLYELGVDQIIAVSALHGNGIGELEEKIIQALPDSHDATPDIETSLPRIAIVGRPNAGKSSLINTMLKDERQIVDDRPGTTVDSIDTVVTWKGQEFVFVDTAGIRRKRSVEYGVESLAVMQAVRAIERSDVAVLMIDAKTGAAEQDAKIANVVEESGRGFVIALNKWDLLRKQDHKVAIERMRDSLSFASWAPLVTISVREGKGLDKLMNAVGSSLKAHRKRIPTSEVNRFFENVIEHHPPPTQKGKSVRLYYITQTSVAPPTFVIMTNNPAAVHKSYKRYVINQLRTHFGFDGTPIRVIYRGKQKRSA